MSARLRLLLLPGLLLLAACSADPLPTPAPPTASSSAIGVALYEWGITPQTIIAPAGDQTFAIANRGQFPHNFTIVTPTSRPATPVLAANQTATLQTHLPPGSYRVICALPGHAEQGMIGILIVK